MAHLLRTPPTGSTGHSAITPEVLKPFMGLARERYENGSGWPSTRYSHDGDDVDLTAELATRLVDGAVAIIMETGAEKLRYFTGWAQAINSRGETRTLNLKDIYEIAGPLGEDITAVSY